MREVVIIEGCRTAVGRRKGAFANDRSDELAAVVLEELMERAHVDKAFVEDVILGCVTQVGEQAMNIARTAALIAGFPTETPGVTIDRQCGSSQQAVHFAAQAIASGDMDVVIAGGVENMTRAPMFSNVGDIEPSPKLTAKYEIVNQGISAEKIAEQWEIPRQALDEFSLNSHKRAWNAIKQGYFKGEIVSVPVQGEDGKTRLISVDEGPRENTSMAALSELKPIFKEDGKITAGNAGQMSDGASAQILRISKKADEHGLKPKERNRTRAIGVTE